jgi:hypothetical protein
MEVEIKSGAVLIATDQIKRKLKNKQLHHELLYQRLKS